MYGRHDTDYVTDYDTDYDTVHDTAHDSINVLMLYWMFFILFFIVIMFGYVILMLYLCHVVYYYMICWDCVLCSVPAKYLENQIKQKVKLWRMKKIK